MDLIQLHPTEDTLLDFDPDTIGRIAGIDEDRENLAVFENSDQVKICYVTAGTLRAFLVCEMTSSHFMTLAN